MDWIEIKYEINSKIFFFIKYICTFEKKTNHKNAKCAKHWFAILQEWNIIQNSKPSSNWRIIFCD
jgi:hypothetical protein